METNYRQAVKEICEKVYRSNYFQIIIDFIQEDVEELVEKDDPTPDDIGSLSYRCSIILEIMNPTLVQNVELLTELNLALEVWQKDRENVNRILGLDPNE